MKTAIPAFFGIVLLSLLTTSCKTSTSSEESTNDSTATASPTAKPVTMIMLPEVGIRDTPGESGKYLTTVYLSEPVTLIGDTASAMAGGKKYHYHKIQLEDGKQGWVRTDFIAIDVIPAVFINETSINKRPDLASVTDKHFAQADLVATRSAKDNWLEVTGIPSGDKWFTTGYVHADNLSYDAIDVSFAALLRRATVGTDAQKNATLMSQLSSSPDFQKSQLYPFIFGTEGGAEEGGERIENTMDDPMEGAGGDNFAYFSMDNGEFGDEYKTLTLLPNGNIPACMDRFTQQGLAANFQGSSFLLSPLFEDTQDITYTFWVWSAKPQTATLFSLGNNCTEGYSLTLNNGMLNVLCGGVEGDFTTSTYKLPTGIWTFLALVKTGSVFNIYVDGELQGTGTSHYNPLDEGNFTIGAGSGCNGVPFGGFYTGAMDDFRIFNRAFEAAEIREQYQQQKPQ